MPIKAQFAHCVVCAYAAAVMRGKLHLIDLAGSERIGRTGAQVNRFGTGPSSPSSVCAVVCVVLEAAQGELCMNGGFEGLACLLF